MSAYIDPVKMDSRQLVKQVSVVTKNNQGIRLELLRFWITLPYIITKIISDCIPSIRAELIAALEDIIASLNESAWFWKPSLTILEKIYTKIPIILLESH